MSDKAPNILEEKVMYVDSTKDSSCFLQVHTNSVLAVADKTEMIELERKNVGNSATKEEHRIILEDSKHIYEKKKDCRLETSHIHSKLSELSSDYTLKF